MADVQKLVTPPFRVSFPNLFEARSVDGGKPKYGLSAIWTPSEFTASDKKKWKAILGAMDAEAQSRFKKGLKELPANVKKGIRDGEEKNLEGYGSGTKFANLTSQQRPGVVDLNKDKIGPEEGNADEIYPGCFCRATVTVYSYDNKGKGIALGLMNVQKIKDGERLDSRTDAAEDFEGDEVDDAWLEQEEDTVDDDGEDDDHDYGI